MARIVPGICSLKQHQQAMDIDPERYRPERCPCCGQAGPWRNGCYLRKADREGRGEASLNPVVIPRFYCPHCRMTCSRLPECVPPRRWYLWSIQQAMLVVVLAGASLRAASRPGPASRRTLGRWWRWLQGRFVVHSFHLRRVWLALGRHAEAVTFWSAALAQRGLGAWMGVLDALGEVVP
jgi:hypothetical protein